MKYDGVSGKVDFDNAGLRSNITVDILEISKIGLALIGTWSYGAENSEKRLKITRKSEVPLKIIGDENSLRNKTLKIITAVVAIYVC